MGRNIDMTKSLSEDDRLWLQQRSRQWEIDENERMLADKDNEEHLPGEVVEPEWSPTNRPPDQPFEPGGADPRRVPRPVTGEPDQEGTPGEEVDIDDLTVPELKAELESRDLDTTGNKTELRKRLKEAVE